MLYVTNIMLRHGEKCDHFGILCQHWEDILVNDSFRNDKEYKKETLKSIGKRIFERRKDLGFSQEELAQKARLSKQTVSQAEVGEQEPKCLTIILLAQALGVSTDFLLLGAISFDEIAKMESKLRGLSDTQIQDYTAVLRLLTDRRNE